jgi:cysteine synthase B
MPRNVSPGRRRLCEAYGARLIHTDPLLGSEGALERVREIVAAKPLPYFYADQYRNPANPLAHFRATGPEIAADTGGTLTHFVAGLGTSGTIAGVGRYFRQQGHAVRIVAVQPDDAFHGIEGLKHMASARLPELYDPAAHDELVSVSTEEALATCAAVLASDALLIGHSAGAALFAARRLARGLRRGVIVALLPDGGARHLGEVP